MVLKTIKRMIGIKDKQLEIEIKQTRLLNLIYIELQKLNEYQKKRWK